MNLFVDEIFKESNEFHQASINAIKVAAYFRSAQHKYFIDQLRDLQKESYSKYIAIAIALKTLGSKFNPSELLNTTTSSQNSLYLLADLSSILMNEAWWQTLYKLSKLLKPYSIAINLLQKDKARLHEQFRTHKYPFDMKSINQFEGEALAFDLFCNESEENTIDKHVKSFNYLINKWENLLAQEVEARQNKNDDMDYDLEIDINEYLLTQTHSVLNIRVK
ncbi:2355_t:CDS:2 [Cetraspora pellucida]|uniref:2355_t:CDS:1 n=1 Tax=Cetraspora pellucida TaxID=1433469 RepID=A0A9N9IUF6_9GLOM|nr:2355_t:CDS:2 [Cetraspora pellucida]